MMNSTITDISLDEAKSLILLGEKTSLEAFEVWKSQIPYNEHGFEHTVSLAKETKNSDMAKAIISFLKETKFNFYPYETTVRRELGKVASKRNDTAAIFALETFAELSKQNYMLEDQYCLREVINDAKDSVVAEAALELLKSIYFEKKDMLVTPETFWNLSKSCKFKHPSFTAFKVCVDSKFFESWNEQYFLGAFDGYHNTKKN